MDSMAYQAYMVEEIEKNRFRGRVTEAQTRNLPPGDLLIRVCYSSLNYKDALSATGNRGVTRRYPHTPGIDAVGRIEQSRDHRFKQGESVIVTSYDLGMNTWGGFGQYIRVPGDWAVPLPNGLTMKESMVLGTAGFTAGMSVLRLTRTLAPGRGTVLVTGATGGVGSIAVGILSHLGYVVTALSGKADTSLVRALGARQVICRKEVTENSHAPLLKPAWAGVVDTVGGPILAAAIKAADLDGVITCCGNVASPDLPINVFPFILRGVSLLGIDSQHCPMDERKKIWGLLARDWKFAMLDKIYDEIPLTGLKAKIDLILQGALTGRTLVNLN